LKPQERESRERGRKQSRSSHEKIIKRKGLKGGRGPKKTLNKQKKKKKRDIGGSTIPDN